MRCMRKQMCNSPVRIVWKASSTLDESKADVSKKDRPFFSAKHKFTHTLVQQ